ncbi:thiamine phosphate synthase [Photobacterium minamisatsumaniensis]|uniref:thiamine phosphate synthase n=1 Tax=Photobacterium minamisatsumaniensis TaxID=2910233 RepID=UPI003D12EC8F
MHNYQLYLVTDEYQDIEQLKFVIKEAVAGGVTMVQLREKHGDVREFIQRAMVVKALLLDTAVPLIINDRVDVALAVDADGVHLGQSDMPAAIARRLIGEDKILGLSVENEKQLRHAQSLPVDYLGLSTIFPTPTKKDTVYAWGIDGLVKAVESSSLPLVAIGGINEGNIKAVADTGTAGIALVSAICHAASPAKASQHLLALMA